MKQLKDGVSINEDVITVNNPLLVINGRVKPKKHYAVNPRVPTIVDANQIISAARMRETNQ